MRRPERKIRRKETLEAMLAQMDVGRLSTVNRKGFPVIKPVNFLYLDKKIYLHSSKKGEKAEDIRRGSLVCFEVDEPIAYGAATGPACKAGYYYRSIIVKGKAAFVDDPGAKRVLLQKLMEKYQPEGGFLGMEEEILSQTAVIEITVQEMTGKERLG